MDEENKIKSRALREASDYFFDVEGNNSLAGSILVEMADMVLFGQPITLSERKEDSTPAVH